MDQSGRRLLGVALGICLLGAPILAHIAIATQRGIGAAGLLVALQSGVVGWLLAGQTASQLGAKNPAWLGLRAFAGCGASMLAIVIWRRGADGLVVASALPHALIYLGLLVMFAGSLAPGRIPVITRIAARARGRLTPALLAYTRSVTIAWCWFFAAQIALSYGLFLLAPLAWWQTFLNLGTVPLVALMFGAELAFRHWRHGIHTPDGQGNMLARLRHMVAQFRAPLRQPEP